MQFFSAIIRSKRFEQKKSHENKGILLDKSDESEENSKGYHR